MAFYYRPVSDIFIRKMIPVLLQTIWQRPKPPIIGSRPKMYLCCGTGVAAGLQSSAENCDQTTLRILDLRLEPEPETREDLRRVHYGLERF